MLSNPLSSVDVRRGLRRNELGWWRQPVSC